MDPTSLVRLTDRGKVGPRLAGALDIAWRPAVPPSPGGGADYTRPAMHRRAPSLAALLAVAAALLVAAPAALAQQAPTLGAPTPQETTPPAPTTTSTTGGGLKSWQELLIFGAGIVLLGGIAVAIIGDARERAPRHSHATATEPAGPKRHRERDKARARAKARTARRQRKRNRRR
jgi:hypothetical protein